MSDVLLVVTDAYDVRGGVELAPKIVAPQDQKGPIDVTLVRPDGTTTRAKADLVLAHVSGPRPPFALVRLAGLRATDVPAGTTVHRETTSAP